MDSLLYTRISMAGWLFLATILASLWEGKNSYWDMLVCWFSALSSSGNSDLAIALFGAIVGIGGPPVIGFIIERFVSLLDASLTANRRQRSNDDDFYALVDDVIEPSQREEAATMGSAYLFRLFFNTNENGALVKYRDWRRTQYIASATSGASILLGLVVTTAVLNTSAWISTVIALTIAFILFAHSNINRKRHDSIQLSWSRVYGRTVVSNSPLGQVPVRSYAIEMKPTLFPARQPQDV